MKLSSKISELLIELVDIESIEHDQLLGGNVGLLCHNLLELYGKTSNHRSHDLIIRIIDQSGYSLFSPREAQARRSDRYEGELLEEKLNLDEDEFMDLLPINGYFH